MEYGGGFSVDASVRVEADDRAGLERLLRYCARPPFALERLDAIDAQRLIYHLPKPQPDGCTELILTPLELIDRLLRIGNPTVLGRSSHFQGTTSSTGSGQEVSRVWRKRGGGSALQVRLRRGGALTGAEAFA